MNTYERLVLRLLLAILNCLLFPAIYAKSQEYAIESTADLRSETAKFLDETQKT